MSYQSAQPPANQQQPSYARPPYSPPQYLLSSTGLSRDKFLAQYEAFIHSLQHIEVAPELVFERLVGNLKDEFNGALTRAYAHHATVEEAWRREKSSLQAELDRATATAEHVAKQSVPRAVSASIPPVLARSDETYLQFWFSSSTTEANSSSGYGGYGGFDSSSEASSTPFPRAHMAATSTPIPYGLVSSWPGMEYIRSSADYGCYDSRMDARITSPFLRTSFSHIVGFKDPFSTPPAVMVWLTGLGAASGASVSVHVTANNITETGFALHVSSRSLRSVGVAWAVWPEIPGWGETKMTVGTVISAARGSPRTPMVAVSEDIAIMGTMLLVAFCAVDVVLGESVWMDVGIGGSPKSFGIKQSSPGIITGPYAGPNAKPPLKWYMSAGPVGSRVYSARAAYAATW